MTYLIAEMASSHDGSPRLAERIIGAAGDSKANAIQFQIWTAADLMVPQHADIGKLRSLELSRDEWRQLGQLVRSEYPQMEIIACVYEIASADFAEAMGVDAYKIHSADVANPRLLQRVASFGKRVDLSVGASTLDEIRQAMDWIHEVSESSIWLMYGYQSFPTRTDEIHLRYMRKLQQLFEVPVGYQDHTDAEEPGAFWLPAAAIGMGVDVIEKHITHNRSLEGADHQAALNPDEFERFAEMVRVLDGAMGVGVPRAFSAEEVRYRRYSKKSIVAARHLPAGTRIREEDLRFMNALELGAPPSEAASMVGRAVRHSIDAYDLVRPEALE